MFYRLSQSQVKRKVNYCVGALTDRINLILYFKNHMIVIRIFANFET
jgi:hypothetical protein